MKKIIMYLLTFIFIINVMGMIASSQGAERPIRVYGNVLIDGESFEDVQIRVKNIDRAYEETDITDDNGSYEVFINGRNNDRIRVEVSFEDEYENDNEFEIEDHKGNYEINFEFESSPLTRVSHQLVDLFFGFDLFTFLIYLILIMFVCLLFAKIIKISK